MDILTLINAALPIIIKHKDEIRRDGDWFYYFDDFVINVYDKENPRKYGWHVYAYPVTESGSNFSHIIGRFSISHDDFKNL
jgi:hypothetical protein